MSKFPSMIFVAVLLAGCNYGPKNGSGYPGGEVGATSGDIKEDLRLLSYPEKLSPCVPFPSSYPPTCEIFRDRFVTKKTINIEIIESERPDNTLCVRTIIVDGKYRNQRKEVDGKCKGKWHEP